MAKMGAAQTARFVAESLRAIADGHGMSLAIEYDSGEEASTDAERLYVLAGWLEEAAGEIRDSKEA